MIQFKDRKTGKIEKELVYGEKALAFLYADNILSAFFSHLTAKIPFFSKLYGFFQKLPISKRKIRPFIKKYQIDETEFLEPVEKFKSFNDFFIRKLKKQARPIISGENIAIIPTDGRFLFFQNIENSDGFLVKGKKFSLDALLGSSVLADEYRRGSLMLGRLCPCDYHRFHFPCSAVPTVPRLINGPLYSVNPISIKKNISVLAENKRVITELFSDNFGKVIYIEVGATNVGSINQTFTPDKHYQKGDEKGFFSFGGSSLILLFEENKIRFDQDLIQTSKDLIETRCLLGQSMGQSMSQG